MGPHNKLAATRQIIDDFEIQALVDHQLGWEEEKRVWSEIESNPQLRRRYNELVDMLMVNPLKEQSWQYTVPFLAQNQMLLKVIRAEFIPMQVWGIYLAAGFGLAAVLWFAAVRRYHQERLAISG